MLSFPLQLHFAFEILTNKKKSEKKEKKYQNLAFFYKVLCVSKKERNNNMNCVDILVHVDNNKIKSTTKYIFPSFFLYFLKN